MDVEVERRRLAALHRLQILDTPAEERFDRIVELAALAIGVPIALVSLVDTDRQWFKARVGLDVDQTAREVSFCTHAIEGAGSEPFVVADAHADDRFGTNPLVVGEPGIRFYAGQVLRDVEGHALGTLCVIDRQPRSLDAEQRRALAHLAQLVEVELRRHDYDVLVATLRERERRQSLILGTMQEGLVLQAPDGRIVEWNRAAERHLGLSADEISGRTSTDPRWGCLQADGSPWPGENHPAMVALATGKPVGPMVMGVHRPDGSLVWLRVNSQPILGETGATEAAITVFADITEQRSVNLQLRASERRLRRFLDELPMPFSARSDDGAIVYANMAFAHIFGSPDPEAFVGRQVIDLVHPDDRAIAIVNPEDEAPIAREVRYLRQDGSVFTARREAVRTELDGEQVVLVTITDVTVERAALDALGASERTMAAVVEAVAHGVMLLDHDGRCQLANAAAAHLLGFPGVEDLLGATIYDLQRILQSVDGAPMPAHHLVGPEAQAFDGVERGYVFDGQVRWLRISSSPLLGIDGLSTGAVMSFGDVTSEHEYLAQLEASEAQFRDIADAAPIGIFMSAASGQREYVNPAWCELTGLSPEAALGLGWLDSLHSDDREPVMRQWSETVKDRGNLELSYRVVTQRGQLRFVQANARPLPDGRYVGSVVDITEQVERERRLTHDATHDVLTGLPNRALLAQRLRDALRFETDGSTALLFIDLDRFKAVNDTHGHEAGDQLLRMVGVRLTEQVRANDTVARLGGDEFVVMLTHTAVAELDRIALRLLTVLEQPYDLGGGIVAEIGACVGVAVSGGVDADELMRRADAAAYRAKRSGRGAVVHHGRGDVLRPAS